MVVSRETSRYPKVFAVRSEDLRLLPRRAIHGAERIVEVFPNGRRLVAKDRRGDFRVRRPDLELEPVDPPEVAR